MAGLAIAAVSSAMTFSPPAVAAPVPSIVTDIAFVTVVGPGDVDHRSVEVVKRSTVVIVVDYVAVVVERSVGD
jgi:hypothetical protein